MKNIFIILFIVTSPSLAFAQTITHSVIGSTGMQVSSASSLLSWTVGETVIETISDQVNIITQGFHQTQLVATSIEQPGIPVETVVYPNPFSDRINIDFNDFIAANVRIIDMIGKVVFTEYVSGTTFAINTGYMPSGVYFVRVDFDNGSSSIFKVVKP